MHRSKAYQFTTDIVEAESSSISNRFKLQKISLIHRGLREFEFIERLLNGNVGILSIDLVLGGAVEDDRVLRLLSDKPNLQRLTLTDIQLHDETLNDIAGRCRSLTDVEISGSTSQVSDNGILFLVTACTDLHNLRLSENAIITDRGLAHIAAHSPNLRALDVSNCTKITVAGIRVIFAGCQELSSLKIGYQGSLNTTEPNPPEDVLTVYQVLPFLPTGLKSLEIVDEIVFDLTFNPAIIYENVQLLVTYTHHIVSLSLRWCLNAMIVDTFLRQWELCPDSLPNLRNLTFAIGSNRTNLFVPLRITVHDSIEIVRAYGTRYWYRNFDRNNESELICASASHQWYFAVEL